MQPTIEGGSMDEKFRNDVEAVLNRGMGLLETQRKQRAKIREKWKSDARDLLDAHCLAWSVISSLTERKSATPGKSSSSLSDRLSLTASFVQGIDVCEVCISEGLYVQAGALVRQEMETLAAVCEVRDGKAKERDVPNVKHVRFGLRNMYGDLSAMAHVSDRKWLSDMISVKMSKEVTGAVTSPIYNGDVARQLYGLHVSLMILLAIEIDGIVNELFGEGIVAMEEQMLLRALDILVKVGYLVPATANSAKK